MRRLPETTQTAYSSLFQKVLDSRFARLGQIGFTTKTVKGRVYWYGQYTDVSGARKQRYLGQDDEATQSLIDRVKQTQSVSVQILEERKRLVAMVIAGGGTAEKGRPAKIIEKLSDAGVFDAGGMLVGSYAFSCYGNPLGVVFDDAMRKTEDIDVAYDRSIEIGFVRHLKEDIASAAPELHEPRQINPWVPPYEMIAPDGFKIEFLTSKSNAADKAPVPIERFAINAQPLQFMDYLMESPIRTVVLHGAGILVNVPDPARFALHKLAVSQLRTAELPEKRRKDLNQAEAIIEYLLDENPGALMIAADAAADRDDLFAKFVTGGIAACKKPGLVDQFKKSCSRMW